MTSDNNIQNPLLVPKKQIEIYDFHVLVEFLKQFSFYSPDLSIDTSNLDKEIKKITNLEISKIRGLHSLMKEYIEECKFKNIILGK